MELIAAGLRAGLSTADALRGARAAADPTDGDVEGSADSTYLDGVAVRIGLGLPAAQVWSEAPLELRSLARAMVLAQVAGAPAAAVISRAAVDLRAQRREFAEREAARLGVRLVLPLGLAILPGFVLLAVVPLVLGLAATILGSAGS